MALKRRSGKQTDQQQGCWLWPMAALLILAGWGQAFWMWNNVQPEGLAPLWLLLWIAAGVSGTAIPIYLLGYRWWPFAILMTAAWAAVPFVEDLLNNASGAAGIQAEWIDTGSPLLLLLLLGVGLSGLMTSISRFVAQRGPVPATPLRPMRQGLWAGIFVLTCGWLLMNRAFTPIPVALLAGALVLIEAFFVTRRLSQGSD